MSLILHKHGFILSRHLSLMLAERRILFPLLNSGAVSGTIFQMENHEMILLAHGGGGRLMDELIRQVIVPKFNEETGPLTD